MSLYRAYRPNTFEHLVGQTHVTQTLKNALKKEEIAHAYIFCGPRGTGKTSSARLIARSLNCETPTTNKEACNTCENCKHALEGKHIDIIEIDAASNRGIDEIRSLQDNIAFAPSLGKKKVYIIDEVHMLTKEAFNALLKTLEEPPTHAHFILATTEIHKVPETIISRCQRFDFKRITPEIITERLTFIATEEKLDYAPEALQRIAEHVNGGMRDALSILGQLKNEATISEVAVNQLLGLSDTNAAEKLFEALLAKNAEEGFKVVYETYQKGSDLHHFCSAFLQLLRKKMHTAVKEKSNVHQIIGIIENFQHALISTKDAAIAELPLEIAITKSCVGAPPKETPAPPAQMPTIQRTHKPITPTPQPVQATTPPKPATPTLEPKNTSMPAVAAQPAVIKSDPITPGNVPEDIEDNWRAIVDLIKKPTIKHSLRAVKIVDYSNDTLTICFNNEFYATQMQQSENLPHLEGALAKFFQQKVSVKVLYNKEAYKAPSANTPSPQDAPPIPTEFPQAKQETIADQAASIFGGEVF